MVSKGRQRPSLASIASALGVSRTTVSNAYNHPEQLSRKLREDILATAERMGYPGPDPTARSLRTKFVGSVGVLFTDRLAYAFEDRASVDFLAGMASASTDNQTSLTLVPVSPESASDPISARQIVNSAVVDGFVVYSVAAGDPHLEAALTRGLPVVVCDQPTNEPRTPFVGINDLTAISPAAQALVEAGHTKIGILCIRLDPTPNNGPVSNKRLEKAKHHVQRARVQGALEVFAAAGIHPKGVPVVERHINDRENNYAAAKELLEAHPELTAVLCTTDTMALGVLEYANDHGISVPDQLSVTGFDGIAPALAKGLSTVIQPNRLKGERAAALLHSLIGEPTPENRAVEILETTFHRGSSVAPPREP